MAFEGKVVVVTGSSFGIGRGIALRFGQEGASLTIHGRSLQGLENCVQYLIENGIPAERIHTVQGAAEDEQAQKRLIGETVQKFGRLDVSTMLEPILKKDWILKSTLWRTLIMCSI
ncbi:hypothetical protein M3Y97_00774700 [Aphelenchoides bicaudatus]|nr:hypothetical protein M3Y97_00774700 [Aphelenchoides bicaudatus]